MWLSPKAKLPARTTPGSVGWDLSSIQEIKVPKEGRKVVDTGLVVALPGECYGRIAPRSGLALRHGIHIGAGVVDPDYRGTLKILVINLGDKEYKIKEGDGIAQLICELVVMPELREEEISTGTARGEQGWGSSEAREKKDKGTHTQKVLSRLGEESSEGLSRGVCDREAPVPVKRTVKPPQHAAWGSVKPGLEQGQQAQPGGKVHKQVVAQPKSQVGRALKTNYLPYQTFPQAQIPGKGLRPDPHSPLEGL
uniref:Deoxyuridine 5'-triphosphate nucleotidohydrolase n=1 Tax=Geotrypetes seraphini TaxID=260995 RepID=A0A6P8PUP3_GEOSA|nr:probable deoxyuridine 5'-triphosphate nucleotidohydrolase [Geotrypetes seraphini]